MRWTGPESGAIVQTAVRSGPPSARSHNLGHTRHVNHAELKALLSGCLLTDFDRPDHLRDIVAYVRNQDINAVFTTKPDT
ncbi:hypothetical protein SALBM311S_02155 [Streptomyces alboniger]